MTIIDYLSNSLLIDEVYLNKYIPTCPYRYKVYTIPKRNGSGVRTIAQPAKELKVLQKLVCERFLSELPVHEACMAYKRNFSIRHNALAHVKNKYMLKMDFKDFFPSITPSDLIDHINNYLEWDICREDRITIEKLFFYLPLRTGEHKLSIGAPTSPFISNTIMYGFDSSISEICKAEKISYTRYADDISFSTNRKNILFDFKNVILNKLDECDYPQIQINHDKTVFLSRKGNMHLTGLVLANNGEVSIGRNKKRYIKSLVYKFSINQISEQEKSYLSGYLSFCWSVEPDFISRLKKKYGEMIINNLMGNGQS